MPSYFKQGEPRLRLCRACSVVFVHPRSTGSELLEQYSPEYFEKNYGSTHRVVYVNPSAEIRKQSFFLQQAAKLTGTRTGSILDVGCGTGRFLAFAQAQGWDTTGLELCAEVGRETAARLRCQVHLGSVFEADLPKETFDVVTMFDCIEHLEGPVQALEICRQVLKPGGVLVVTTPNFQGIGRLMLGPEAVGIWPDTHIIYFGPRSLRFALRQAKFDHIRTSSREIYPENVATILAHLRGRKGSCAREVNPAEPAVWSIKKRFRNNPVLQSLRTALNTLFGAVPIGDDLFAFAVKR
jgi:SAM-dependent methyltransferase